MNYYEFVMTGKNNKLDALQTYCKTEGLIPGEYTATHIIGKNNKKKELKHLKDLIGIILKF